MALEASQKITPFLWFNDNADEAVDYYLSIFPNSKRTDGLKWPDGRTLTISFELEGVPFTALNGGPQFTFNESVSFFVRCKGQAEIDYYWNKLTTDGSKESDCGWLKDKYGLSWQIVPADIFPLVRNEKGMAAMMKMKKLVIADLEAAARES